MGSSKQGPEAETVDVEVKAKRTRKPQAPRMTPDDVLTDLERLVSVANRMIVACNDKANKVTAGSNAAMRIERVGSLWVTIGETVAESAQTIEVEMNNLYGIK